MSHGSLSSTAFCTCASNSAFPESSIHSTLAMDPLSKSTEETNVVVMLSAGMLSVTLRDEGEERVPPEEPLLHLPFSRDEGCGRHSSRRSSATRRSRLNLAVVKDVARPSVSAVLASRST
jgi:hypothetical protein